MYHLAKAHFKKVDPVLYRVAQIHRIADIRRSRDVFGDLVNAIINQQLSGKAAATIYERLEALILKKAAKKMNRGGRQWGKGKPGAVTPKSIATIRMSTLRKCGLSEAKAKSIKSLAKAVVGKKLDLANIHLYEDDKVMELLISQKGIGPWTAEMILMFSLGRRDIFSKGDLGLRKGIMRLYGLKKMPGDKFMDKLAKTWSPYRTYAARVLWRVADGGK
jgi:3-methyladenine DNA glycosylase/8-oxoguanine DNA glycosylase